MLSTKAFSSLLTREWFGIFKEWITYPVLAVHISFYLPCDTMANTIPGIDRYGCGTDPIPQPCSDAL